MSVAASEASSAALSRPSLAVPRRLPVRSLSASSIRRLARCPEQWRRHYLLGEPELVGAAALAGRAYGAAVAAWFWARIRGESLSSADADDLLGCEYAAEVAEAEREHTLVDEDVAGALEGARAPLRAYLGSVAPRVAEPRAIERELRAAFPGAEWSFVGYLDLDCARLVVDHKLSGASKWSQRTADVDPQAGWYLLLRALAGDPAERFEFHVARPGREEIAVIETRRSAAQLAHLEGRIALCARRIARAQESGDWGYGTEGWWCSERWCSHYWSCGAGGALLERER